MATPATEERPARPSIAAVLAWRTYLRETRAASDEEYEQVEERAWERLATELERLDRRRG